MIVLILPPALIRKARGPDKSFLRDMLQDLDTVASAVLLRDCSTPLDPLRLVLERIDCEIERLIDQGLLRHRKGQHPIMALVERKLDEIENNMRARDALEAAYVQVDINGLDKSSYLPMGTIQGRAVLFWHRFCRNKVNPPTEEQLVQGNANGIDIPFRVQYLPRGCCTILEHWRKEVNDIVDSIIQVRV